MMAVPKAAVIVALGILGTLGQTLTDDAANASDNSTDGASENSSHGFWPLAPEGTKDMSRQQLQFRRRLFGGIIAAAVAVVAISGVAAAAKKTRKIEMLLPRPRRTEVAIESKHLAIACAVSTCGLLLLVFLLVPYVPSWSKAPLGLIAAVVVLVGPLLLLKKRYSISIESVTLLELPPEYVELSQKSKEKSQGTVQASTTSGTAEIMADEQGAPTRSQHPDTDEQTLLGRRELYREKLRSTFERHRSRRRCVLVAMLAVYLAICCSTPLLFARSADCSNGFLWEDHMPFLLAFMLTKFAELMLYTWDPTIDGELPLYKFMLVYLPSFLGYADGYQDAVSIQITYDCSKEGAQASNHDLARLLSWTMTGTYFGGVVLLQWILLGCVALIVEPSLACLAKLVHMDALAACISVPADKMWLWYTINLARTFGEDVIQAAQQMLFVTQVKVNYFMLVSIAFSVLTSIKALYEACHRKSEAAGAEQRALTEAQAQEQLRVDILAACGKLPDSPSLAKLNRLVLSPYYTGNIDQYSDERGSTPLMYCVGPRNEDTVDLVREMVTTHLADVNQRNSSGMTALSFAKAWHKERNDGQDVIDLLLSLGSDPSVPSAF